VLGGLCGWGRCRRSAPLSPHGGSQANWASGERVWKVVWAQPIPLAEYCALFCWKKNPRGPAPSAHIAYLGRPVSAVLAITRPRRLHLPRRLSSSTSTLPTTSPRLLPLLCSHALNNTTDVARLLSSLLRYTLPVPPVFPHLRHLRHHHPLHSPRHVACPMDSCFD
jgi:hypothetical protein